MTRPDLSVLIPARNELWLRHTVETVLARSGPTTEVIVVLDGTWSPDLDEPGDGGLTQDDRLTVVKLPAPIGQRAAVNLAAKISTARYVMKLDGHSMAEDGFDAKLIAAGEALGHDVTQIPRMYNLHVFDWQCRACGIRTYQGPTLTSCATCHKSDGFDRVIVWSPRWSRVTDFARFDHTMVFQYWGSYKKRPEATGDIVDLLSSVGACFFMRRERFWELGGLDEAHGSWGQFGTEISCKSWLSGGRQVVNKATWFSHLFRTQGGDFGFPYVNPEAARDRARARSRELWLHNRWPAQVRPLAWLIDKFQPIPDWSDPVGADALAQIARAAASFTSVLSSAPVAVTKPAPLTILSARYGPRTDPARAVDVTEAVAAAVRDGKLSIVVSNEALKTGPVFQGVRKLLVVRYALDGVEFTARALERETLTAL